MRFRSTLGFVVAAVLALAATDAAAQNYRPIRAPEAAAAQAQDVYQLVEKLRPEWLWLGGDPQFATSRAKVRVFVDGNQVGGLEALRGLTLEKLASVRTAGRELVRARDGRMDPAVVGALLVRYEEAPPKPGRMEVSAGMGHRADLEARALDDMEAGNMDIENRVWAKNANQPFVFYLTGKLRLGRGLGTSLNVLHTGGLSIRGMPLEPPFVGHSNRFSTTDLAAQAFAEWRMIRVGAGPALRVLQYTQTTGGCECNDEESGSKLVAGASADLAISAPAVGPVHLELVYGARWFPAHAVPAYLRAPELELGGFTNYLTIGAVLGF